LLLLSEGTAMCSGYNSVMEKIKLSFFMSSLAQFFPLSVHLLFPLFPIFLLLLDATVKRMRTEWDFLKVKPAIWESVAFQ